MQVYVKMLKHGGGEIFVVKRGKGRLVADGNTSEECSTKAGEIQAALEFATGETVAIEYANAFAK